MSEITIYPARRIHTMSPSNPIAEAVAVRDGIILEAGRIKDMQPWLEGAKVTVDEQFADKVLFPGFIDPHLHPSLGATLLPCQFITAFEWDLGKHKVPATRGRTEYLARLQQFIADRGPSQELFVTWGYHRTWHGIIGRPDLNAIAPDVPVILWHRSFHEVILNDAAIDKLNLDRQMMASHPQIDADLGVFFETGGQVALNALRPHLFAPTWFGRGLQDLKQLLHAGGHTTVGDMAWGIFDFELEWQSYIFAIEQAEAPFRVQMIPRGIPDAELTGTPEEALARIETLSDRGSHRLFFDKHVKLFTDGAFFSQLMQVQEPGFIDGHHGEWLTAPEQFEAACRAYWNAGYRIHVHCTGDLGVELALDVLDKLQFERPRFDHRFTIEHFGVSTEEQVRRIKALGALVSANVYYLHELGEAYWRHNLGHERASQMARLGSLAREGVPFALHSDFTMAPARPLTSVWVAVNRIAESGAVLGPNERISVDQAMRAITIDAAYVLGQEQRIGSIRAGKSADFTVLDDDPYEVAPETIRDIRVHGTVFEGTPHLVKG
ncbi:N-substituted formamide deformylase precursor [Falsiruegeria litorea R37]|uniref:N-substituted formamide deformylase n=1 Tax=Falsiruegeria litorea R37 TaxID=1200284 RepID=A0A1Y5TUI3_9RHOB|nr:amidohydrolase [Falsiruegeria litorea]SLN73230.1 N-substituted formamide deformylase precursor [Falsiruegeria litorea R37]